MRNRHVLTSSLVVLALGLGTQVAFGQIQTPAAPVDAPSQATPPQPKKVDPFSFADFTWQSGSPRTTDSPWKSGPFTGEFRADVNYTYSFNKPADDTIVGSSEVFRHAEV